MLSAVETSQSNIAKIDSSTCLEWQNTKGNYGKSRRYKQKGVKRRKAEKKEDL